MMESNDFLSAVNQIAAERGIDPEEVLEAVKTAIRTSFRKNYGTGESLVVDFNKDNGKLQVFADKKVVKKVTDKSTQISLSDAKEVESKLKVGDHVQVDVTPEGDFGRIAVQAAKQVILQKVRESEKETIMKEFKDQIGTVESGIIQRMDQDNVLVEIRKAISVMPAEERLPGEFYRSGDRMKFLLKEIARTARGKQLIVSRADPDFLAELFALEVPEIRSGSVEIKAVAREAGSRSKVAVISNQQGVDPIGACVGQKGIRIDNITDELKGEKIDIILWDEDIEIFIANSLSPAQVKKIKANEKLNEAKVVVPDDQLSLAIGKDGQNVRLAAKLTGWKIDIEGETQKTDEAEADEKDSEKKEKKSKSTKVSSDKAKKSKKTSKKKPKKAKKDIAKKKATTAKAKKEKKSKKKVAKKKTTSKKTRKSKKTSKK